MKILFQIFPILVIFSVCVYPQEDNIDTTRKIISYDSLQKLQYKFDEFEIYRRLNYMRLSLPATGDSNTIWMWTQLAITNSGNSGDGSENSPSELTTPLYLQLLENSKLNPVRYVLGMAQTAAVGYLAYKHIKKYGLFK